MNFKGTAGTLTDVQNSSFGKLQFDTMKITLKMALFLVLDVSALFVLAGVARGQTTPTMPTFYARRDYAEPNVTQIQVADTNKDGIPDIVINNSGLIVVMLGNGDGTFRPGPSSTTALVGSQGFALADLNGDGIVDVVLSGGRLSGGNASGGICVSFGNGDGTFQTGTFYSTGSDLGLRGPVIGDFNGDGILDLVAPGGAGVWLFTGQGGGTFKPGVIAAPLASSPDTVAAADFNGDKKLDLVIPLNSGGTEVMLGNGNGTFQPAITLSQPGAPLFLAVGSLTKGGPPSIALNDGKVISLYYGSGTGTFSGPYTIDTPAVGGGMAIGDVNGDGIPDLVSAGCYIFFGTGGGKLTNFINVRSCASCGALMDIQG